MKETVLVVAVVKQNRNRIIRINPKLNTFLILQIDKKSRKEQVEGCNRKSPVLELLFFCPRQMAWALNREDFYNCDYIGSSRTSTWQSLPFSGPAWLAMMGPTCFFFNLEIFSDYSTFTSFFKVFHNLWKNTLMLEDLNILLFNKTQELIL